MKFWPLTSYNDIPTNQTFHKFHDLDTARLTRITSSFHGAFAMAVACKQGTLTPPEPWTCPTFRLAYMYVLLLRPLTFNHTLHHQFITLWFYFLPNMALLNIGFPGASVMIVACRQGTLTLGSVPPFGTCSCSNCWDQFSRTCLVFSGLFTLNTPRYLIDFAYYKCMHWEKYKVM